MPALVDLPTELLDRIYRYLDWDRTADLIPTRPDIINLSLTCKRIRESIIPLLFRNATLCLRWVGDVLIEPSLHQLRRHRPDLAQHVREVYVVTALAYQFEVKPDRGPFRVPDNTRDWLSPEIDAWKDSRHYIELNAAHRWHVDRVVQGLYEKMKEICGPDNAPCVGTAEEVLSAMVDRTSRLIMRRPQPSSSLATSSTSQTPRSGRTRIGTPSQYYVGSAMDPTADLNDNNYSDEVGHVEDEIRQHVSLSERLLKQQVDALAAAVLCLPATVNSLIFEAPRHGGPTSLRNLFARQVLAAAIDIFGHRLEGLTAVGLPSPRRRDLTLRSMREGSTPDVLTTGNFAQLSSLRRLVLAGTSDPASTQSIGPRGISPLGSPLAELWQAIPTTNLAILELWNIDTSDRDFEPLLNFVKRFPDLQTLRFQNIYHSCNRTNSRIYPNIQGLREPSWLHIAISLRRALPLTTELEFGCIATSSHVDSIDLPSSALEWLTVEAVPPGAVIDFQREERLCEDFESFLFLWRAEDSERGAQAARERKSGALVDAAMCNRWKQFSNVRRDQGEWTTL